jgi:hypothetical protein
MPPPLQPTKSPPLTQRWLRRKAKEKIADAEVLLQHDRYEGAWYLCGYAIEFYLKARICTTLQWSAYPNTSKEFEGLKDFKVHKLEMLLKLSGRMRDILNSPTDMGNWSVVVLWDPEARYQTARTITQADAQGMIAAAKALMRVL